jgi:hypothetical protein
MFSIHGIPIEWEGLTVGSRDVIFIETKANESLDISII